MAKKTSEQNTSSTPDAAAVSQRAYEIWQREGCPEGCAMEHWLRAEAEIAGAGASASDDRASSGNLKVRPRRTAGKGAERQFQIAGR
jgi:hypothetical protein